MDKTAAVKSPGLKDRLKGLGETLDKKSLSREEEKKEQKEQKNTEKRAKKEKKGLKETITDYGYEYDQKKIIFQFVGFAAVTVLVAVAFHVEVPFAIMMVVLSLLFTPGIIKNGYRRQYEEQRFRDANSYLEQLLYSFKKDKKITVALTDVEDVFNDGPVKSLIANVLKYINSTFDAKTNKNPEKVGLQMIEDVYPTSKIKTTHKILLEAEADGGDPERTINLLLEDRAKWDENNRHLVSAMQEMKRTITIAILITLGLCAVFARILGQAMPDLDMTHMKLVEIVTVVLWGLDLFIYKRTDDKVSVDFLEEKQVDEDKLLESYYSVLNHDARAGWLNGIKHAIIPAILALVFVFAKLWALVIISLGVALLLVFLDKIDYSLDRRTVITQVRAAFPQWLMSITLLSQSHNVQNSILASYKNAPVILRPELKKMLEGLKVNPESKEPFHQFMRAFDMKDISSSMMMLYAAQGGTGNPAEQIENVLRRNQTMADEAAKQEIDDKIGTMYALFLAPSITAAMKLIVDMMLFMVLSMSYATTSSGI